MSHRLHRAVVSFVAAIALAGFVAPACAEVKASKDLLQGSWAGKIEIDEAALKADEKFKDVPAEQADLVLGLIKGQLEKMSMNMTFNADGTATAESNGPGITAKEKKKEGTWEVVKTDGASITVKVTPKESNEKDPPKDMVLTFISDKQLSMALPEEAAKVMPKGITFKFTKK